MRVNPLRPLTAATLIVAAGLIAALPFRRSSPDATNESPGGIATGPRSTVIDAAATSPNGEWPAGRNFDPTLAWQPIPMTLPQRSSPELPPMPDSYYDLAFELEQPDSIRQRFSAAVNHRGEPNAATVPTPALRSSEPAQRPDAIPFANQELAAEDLIKDRFVYTPIELPAPPSLHAQDSRHQRGTHAQSASMIRTEMTPQDDASRPRHFIREPQ